MSLDLESPNYSGLSSLEAHPGRGGGNDGRQQYTMSIQLSQHVEKIRGILASINIPQTIFSSARFSNASAQLTVDAQTSKVCTVGPRTIVLCKLLGGQEAHISQTSSCKFSNHALQLPHGMRSSIGESPKEARIIFILFEVL